jgi:uncharacterized protein YwgA
MFISILFSNKLDPKVLEEESDYLGGLIKRVSNFSMNSLDDRLRFQKTVYLMQAFGIPLGYNFNWYIRGVYSSRVAEIGFNLKSKIDNIKSTEFSEEKYEVLFKKFLNFIEPFKNEVMMLEIFSSLHWFAKRKPGLDKEVYIDLVANAKGIDIDTIEKGWDEIQKAGIV